MEIKLSFEYLQYKKLQLNLSEGLGEQVLTSKIKKVIHFFTIEADNRN
ncbi:hypothetical protein SAMN05444364_10344 [Prevotella scopos JCM 17725]|uniref:Uncharacterized protein n=1 Tax=Prevotella scopos JCM 17725 TaxID=1236518 RepID=A0AAX2F221_9BACT|nr:hypothetical protein SAMN05444364_10344 [Prevotella scopos JCM 17725]